MRFIRIEEARPGMLLAEEITDVFGRMLIAGEAILTTQYIEKLIAHGISGIYIEDELSEGISLEPSISPALRAQAMSAVKVQDIDQCKTISSMIVKEMLEKGHVSLDMQDLRTFDNYTFAHSVHVAVLACTLGLGLGMLEDELEILVISSLLHDMGKLSIPDEIINKPSRLTAEEYALVKTHPLISWEMIKDRIDLSSFIKNAVLAHHENFDGSGYPNGLSDEALTIYAKILHVVDVYDALVSRRPYKEPYSSYAALDIIEGGKGTLYDPAIVDAFIQYVPLYPKGTTVELSDGRKGIVIENSGEHNRHPRIRLLDNLLEIDLLHLPDITVSTPGDSDLYRIMKSEKQRSAMLEPFEPKTVIVLDPHEETYQNLSEKLGYLHNFIHMKSEAQAEAYVKKNGYPDLLIVDIDYKVLSEDDNIKEINKRVSGHVPVLMIGSYSDIRTIQHFRKSGINNYILKPYHMIYLQSEMKRIFETL